MRKNKTVTGPAMAGKTAALLMALAAAACTVGPDYERPAAIVPVAYKEAVSRENGWKAAQPADMAELGPWWSIYNDPVLDALERQVEVSNQNVKAAEAAFRNARALVQEARSSYFPTVTASGSGDRSGPFRTQRSSGGSLGSGRSGGTGGGSAANVFDLGVDAGWVPDVWGRIGRSVESNVAGAQVSAADVAAARLSAQAELAIDYFQLRSADELKGLLDASVRAYEQSLAIARNRYNAGTAAQADVVTAQAQLVSTQSQAVAVGVQRAQFEHAIAVLIGKPPSDLTIAPAPLRTDAPLIPAGIPSALLERRPDIAAGERQMAQANAQIGVAEAAYYPDLTLTGSLSTTALMVSNLLRASTSLWAFGGQIAGTLFDGGARAAQVEAAQATLDRNVASYRQTVLTAFQQVEDQLAAQRILAQQAQVQAEAVRLAQEAERLMLNQYRAGTVPYTDVLTAQTTSLTNQQSALTIRQNRLVASVTLIEALGGGWSTTQLPSATEVKAAADTHRPRPAGG